MGPLAKLLVEAVILTAFFGGLWALLVIAAALIL